MIQFCDFTLEVTNFILGKLGHRWDCVIGVLTTARKLAKMIRSENSVYRESKLHAIIDGTYLCLLEHNIQMETLLSWVSLVVSMSQA